MALITKGILDTITGALYPSASVDFSSVTPASGETAIATLTAGFTFVREPKPGRNFEESEVKLYLAADASITASQLKSASVVALTIDGVTLKYRVSSLLSLQQLGAGFVLRLSPLQGATG